jgi:NIMA (never in mitosis gene a)-related kinase
LQEVELLESLDHPHIIKYLDSFIDQNDMYIAVEWAERGDLKRVIRHARTESEHLDEIKVWEYVWQIASALEHMKSKRIMHRDLKPANIFISGEGLLKVGDLGLGRQLSSQTIEAYSRVGTPLYMSPEVLNGEGYDWKSDIWSLGCIAYEL